MVLLLVILNLKGQSPQDQKKHVVSKIAIGAERFDSVVVCWQKFETATSAGVAFLSS